MQRFASTGNADEAAGIPGSSRGPSPALSVILPADQPESIDGVLGRLANQTMAADLEIVIATPRPSLFDQLREDHGGFHSVSVVEVTDLSSLGAARALAVQAARADCVFLGETHSFAAAPEWAERLIMRHREGWAVVVPGFRNANPGPLLGWAGFLLDYGGWLEQKPAGEIEYWPLNNACCDRAAILAASRDPAHDLSFGDQLILTLRAAGCRVYLEPKAALSHLNITRLKPWLGERWIAGHLVAWHRSRDWPLFRRLVFAAAAPLIALTLFGRVWRPAWRTLRLRRLSIAILPIIFLAACVQALGELFGYAHVGDRAGSERRMTEYELHKVRYT